MASFMKSVETVNSTVRTFLAIVVVGALGVGGWFGYETVNENKLAKERLENAELKLADTQGKLESANQAIVAKNEKISALNIEVEEQQKEIAEQQKEIARLNLLKVDHRVARLRVIDQFEDPETEDTMTKVSFVELDERDQEIDDPVVYTLQGEQVYVDGWVVKFDDKYIEESDIHRSTALFIFRRLYGDGQEPRQGFLLDSEGSAPKIYTRGDEMSDFEKRIWDDFWSVANDKDKQDELGVHAAHGLSAHVKVKKGMSYRVELGATGDVSLIPEDAPPEPDLDAS